LHPYQSTVIPAPDYTNSIPNPLKDNPKGNPMLIAQSLLAEFEAQVPVTRKFLERLPNNKLTWKPHPRSMTAGQLAYHLALVPGGVVRGAQKNQIPPPDFQFPQPATVQQVLDAFDQSVATVREVLPGFDDAAMNATWRIVAGDQEIAAMPRVAFLRNIMLNHWYQHRGQFSVYLRLLDIPVPSSWGPSADERSVLQPEPQPA
jgi:uncharacterized damage-inducible protein DinB